MLKLIGWLAACALAVSPARADEAAPPLEAYGRLPTINHLVVSPDGSRIGFVVSDPSGSQLQIRQIDSSKLLVVANLGRVKVRALEWAGDGHLLVTNSVAADIYGVSGPKSEYSMVSDVNVAKRRARPLLPLQESALNVVVASPTVVQLKGKPVVFLQGVSFQSDRGVVTLYRADLEREACIEVAVGNELTESWMVDPTGRPVAKSEYDERSGRWRLLALDGAFWRERHAETAKIERPSLEGFARDGRGLLVSSFDGDAYHLHEASADGAWSGPLDLDGGALVFDPVSRALLGGAHTKATATEYVFFSPRDQKAWDAVAKAFRGENVELTSWSDDRTRLAVRVAGAAHGYAYYLVDLKTGRADWLADVYAGVGATRLAEVKVIHYAAADGLDIPAYLTLPKGGPGKGLPLVVLAHGGPAARDEPGFDWWAQALASRGYAVLQPQFRGSDGFGRAHLAAGFGEWGRKMQTDLSDGVRALAGQGLVDPKRVCIVGASYGGYAALAGVTLDPGVYRCAVSVAGLSDLRSFLGYEQERAQGRDNDVLRYWDRFLGVASPFDRKLDAISPARLAAKADVPVLLIHGRDDTVVPFSQSTAMERALKQAGKPVTLVSLDGEDHWLSRGPTRLRMLDETVKFLTANNPPG